MLNLKDMLKSALTESNNSEKVKKYEEAIDSIYRSLHPILNSYKEALTSCGNMDNLTEENINILVNHFMVQKLRPDDFRVMINILSDLQSHIHKTTNKDSVTSGDTSTLK
jgi:hypothetical protein